MEEYHSLVFMGVINQTIISGYPHRVPSGKQHSSRKSPIGSGMTYKKWWFSSSQTVSLPEVKPSFGGHLNSHRSPLQVLPRLPRFCLSAWTCDVALPLAGAAATTAAGPRPDEMKEKSGEHMESPMVNASFWVGNDGNPLKNLIGLEHLQEIMIGFTPTCRGVLQFVPSIKSGIIDII